MEVAYVNNNLHFSHNRILLAASKFWYFEFQMEPHFHKISLDVVEWNFGLCFSFFFVFCLNWIMCSVTQHMKILRYLVCFVPFFIFHRKWTFSSLFCLFHFPFYYIIFVYSINITNFQVFFNEIMNIQYFVT